MSKRIAIVLVAVLALAACGSSKSSGSGDNGSHLPTAPGATNGNGGGTNSGFASLVEQAKNAKYKVTYSSDNRDVFTIAQDPPKFAMIEGDSATYVTADGSSVSCSGTGSAATCTQLPGTGSAIQQGMASAFGAVGQLFVTLANENLGGLSNFVHIKTTSKSIAGRDAECAALDKSSLGVLGASIGNASYQVCVDKDTGVMLSTKTTDQSGKTDEVTATDFSSPSDSDFTPPATPSTIPGLGSTPST
ncbi:MAG TPA: hypothetical protein VH914_07115 [Acidimicrobiia bacterium]|jgi:hypothetical protein|nr:hypothetical protein [Acidimicrobiia bacterium]